MSNPVVELSYQKGKYELLVDGEPMKRVHSVTVTLAAGDIPRISVALVAGSFRYVSDVKGDLVADQEMVEDK